MGFGERLKAARKAKRLSGEALGKAIADRLGLDAPISKQTISHWENGRYQPNIEQLTCLCTLLGVSADHLLLDADQMGADPTLQDFIREYTKMSPEQKAVWKPILSTALPPSNQHHQGTRITDELTTPTENGKERLQ